MKPKFQQSADTGVTSKDLLYGGPLPSLLLLNLLRPLIFYDLLALTAKTAASACMAHALPVCRAAPLRRTSCL